MRVFVTGGAGYVGSHCVRHLLSAGHEVTVYDNLSRGHRQAVHPQALFVEGDLADRDKLGELLQADRFDAVMHFAAFLDVAESVRAPLRYYRNNVANTLNLLEGVQAAGIRRFIFSSSCAIYGEPGGLPLTEEMPRDPISPYGTTKLAVEHMLEYSAKAWGLGAVALRYFNAAGAAADGSIGEDHSPETHLIPLVLQVALGQRDRIDIYGSDYPTPDGSCVRDYVHVDDLAEAHLLALRGVEPGHMDAFNVGTGSGASVLAVVEAARNVTGHPIPSRVASRRPGDPPALYADCGRLRSRFGWEPRYRNITAIVESAWKWHRDHPHGYLAQRSTPEALY